MFLGLKGMQIGPEATTEMAESRVTSIAAEVLPTGGLTPRPTTARLAPLPGSSGIGLTTHQARDLGAVRGI